MNLAFFIRLALGCCAASLWCAQAQAAPSAPTPLGVLSQAENLPSDFSEHFFDVPLAVRVDLDGRFLGEAMIVLSRNETVQLLEFTQVDESHEPDATRQRWRDLLVDGRSLGNCLKDCAQDLVALHYSLVNSQLSILTRAVEQDPAQARFYSLPEQGSRGLIVRNQLNLARDGDQTSGRYALQGQSSLGSWTGLANVQADRSNEVGAQSRHRVDQLYGERLSPAHFFRLGYFTPSSQGLTRQPRLMGSSPDATVGVMFGSSDSLAINNGAPSSTPIYVTPNRPGVVEIYRNGQLINSQPVQAGLQAIDTRVLPGGIYEVEVRLVEDGQVTSRTPEFIYKPGNWANPEQRWRYNLFAGQQRDLLSNWDNQDEEGGLSAGVLTNYLLHPRAVVGLSAQRVDDRVQYGTSLDWDPHDRFKLFGNLYHTQDQGDGFDLQGIFNYERGSLVASHTRAWTEPPKLDRRDNPRRYSNWRGGQTQQSSLSLSHRLTRENTVSARLSHSSGAIEGMAMDLGWAYHGTLKGSDATWRLSLFDRPGTYSSGSQRNRGVNLSLSLALGKPGQRLSASVGSQTSRDGGRDQTATLTYQQDLQHHTLRSVSGSVSADRYGAGFGANTQFQNGYLFGDAYAQNSSYNGELSGGLNLESTLALGEGHVAMSGEYGLYDAGLIVDVDSDLAQLDLRADDISGASTALHPGRNVIAVQAYKSGSVQLDFAGRDAHAAVIQPASLGYHLNKGGVEYRQVRVMRTLTVLGRLLDGQGQPLKGALVINHASRSVSEADGFFAVEMSESTPTLEVRHKGARVCFLRLDARHARRENEVLLVGDQRCTTDTLAQADGAAGEGA
ncbi:TcfC E-set like domain-containing protein [Pseudomonas sp. App30]|uniref:TcfC E-set like domain-containing protein n=1 Tax=Pseudomonas sp. App30 TaxID=3068990 RepID=UPI003A7FEB52